MHSDKRVNGWLFPSTLTCISPMQICELLCCSQAHTWQSHAGMRILKGIQATNIDSFN